MYTAQEEAQLKDLYGNGEEADVEVIAEKLGKSKKSVIGKLVSLNLYVPKARVSKVTGGAPKTKADIVKEIETVLEVELKDLDKAPKTTLLNLQKAVEEWFGS